MRGRHRVTGSTGGRKFVSSSKSCPSICHWDATTPYKIGDQVVYKDRFYEALVDSTTAAHVNNLNQPPGSFEIEGLSVDFDKPFPWAIMTGTYHITFKGSPAQDGQLTFLGFANSGSGTTGKGITVNLTAGMPASAIASELADGINRSAVYQNLQFQITAVGDSVVFDTDNIFVVPSVGYLQRFTPTADHLTALNKDAKPLHYWKELGASTHVLYSDNVIEPQAVSATSMVKEFDVTLDSSYLLRIEAALSTTYDNEDDYTNVTLEVDGNPVAFANTPTHSNFYKGGCTLLWTSTAQGKHHAKLTLDRSAGVTIDNFDILAVQIPV